MTKATKEPKAAIFHLASDLDDQSDQSNQSDFLDVSLFDDQSNQSDQNEISGCGGGVRQAKRAAGGGCQAKRGSRR